MATEFRLFVIWLFDNYLVVAISCVNQPRTCIVFIICSSLFIFHISSHLFSGFLSCEKGIWASKNVL